MTRPDVDEGSVSDGGAVARNLRPKRIVSDTGVSDPETWDAREAPPKQYRSKPKREEGPYDPNKDDPVGGD